MRVIFEIDEDWKVIATCAESRFLLGPRQLRKLPDDDGAFFPFPPEDDLPGPGELHAGLCDGTQAQLVSEIHQRITQRAPLPEEVEKFGRYLFQTLIGARAWQAIDAACAGPLELALQWSARAAGLHRLNWEMMHGPDGFLAAGRPRRVAITRVVAGTPYIPRALSATPRILFIIGTRLYDPAIRAGAEVLGLLRQLSFNGRTLHSRIVDRASPAKMRAAVRSFRPDVVHLIGHGGIDPADGRGYLLMRKDDENATGDERRDAVQLLEYLAAAGSLPPIVILSACHLGGGTVRSILGAHEAAPLAVELIAGGVPAVIGMAGRVADSACRLFTRRCGETLLSGEALIAATEEGRRCAFADGPPPQRSVDWAFPAVFLSSSVPPDFVPAPPVAAEALAPVEKWITDYKLGRDPVFCAREDFFEAYYAMLDSLEAPRPVAVLAAYVDAVGDGFGQRRLLDELAIHALHDGHVPCLVRFNPGDVVPTTPGALGFELLKTTQQVRAALGLKPTPDSALMQTLLFESPHPNDARLRQAFGGTILFAKLLDHLRASDCKADATSVLEAFRQDVAALLGELATMHPVPMGTTRRCVVLIHAIDRFGKLTSELLDQMLGPRGLGGPGSAPIPVVLTFSSKTVGVENIFKPLMENGGPSWMRFEKLAPFRDDGEDFLAYERVWLNPTGQGPGRLTPCIINPEAEDLEDWRSFVRETFAGMPSRFLSRDFTILTKGALRRGGHLMAADDEELLRRLRKGPKDNPGVGTER